MSPLVLICGLALLSKAQETQSVGAITAADRVTFLRDHPEYMGRFPTKKQTTPRAYMAMQKARNYFYARIKAGKTSKYSAEEALKNYAKNLGIGMAILASPIAAGAIHGKTVHAFQQLATIDKYLKG